MDGWDTARRIMKRQDEAYRQAPALPLWKRPFCRHEHTRCTHGDEIIARMSWRGVLRRQVCLDCGRALDRDLPEMCFFTEQSHAASVLSRQPGQEGQNR